MWWIIVELLHGKLLDMCGEAPRLALCPRLLLIIINIHNKYPQKTKITILS